MKKISAKIIADSIDGRGNRIVSYILTYPRFIHAELMTHRMFSRNAASSRAIPLVKMMKSVEEDPVVPIAFQKKHSGMQGTEYITDEQGIKVAKAAWLMGADSALAVVKAMDMLNITKQLCNRILEPYLWYTVLVTATEYDNWFELRVPQYSDGFKSRNDVMTGLIEYEGFARDHFDGYTELDWIQRSESAAEIHIQALAEAMWDAKNENTSKRLKPGEWHIPFGDKIDTTKLPETFEEPGNSPILDLYKIKIATARAARLSYMTFDGEIDIDKDIALHDSLLKSKHMSPFEHCAKMMTDEEYRWFHKSEAYLKGAGGYQLHGWCRNFRGFIPYRHIVEDDS